MCETSLIFDCSIPYWAYPHLQYSSGSRGCLTLICKFCSFLQSSQPVHCSAVVRLLLLLWVVGAPASVPANEAKRQNVCQQFWLLLLLPPATVPLLLHLALFFCAFSLPPFRRSAIPPFRHSPTRHAKRCNASSGCVIAFRCACIAIVHIIVMHYDSLHCYVRMGGRSKRERERMKQQNCVYTHSCSMTNILHFWYSLYLNWFEWCVPFAPSACSVRAMFTSHTHTH